MIRLGFLPSDFQKASTSTPAGKLGSSFVIGRSLSDVASITNTLSTFAGNMLPDVASHLRPFKRAVIDLSFTGPLPSRGNVATTASTCSYLKQQSFYSEIILKQKGLFVA